MGIGGGDDGYEDERGRRFGDDQDTRSLARGGTRTWLPDGDDADLYEGARRPPVRIGRSVITVVGVVVLLIAAIAFANQSEEKGSGGGDGKADSRTEAQPTTPTGEQPVTGKSEGIPSGFPQTEQGAQSAAANYAVALDSDGMFSAEQRARIVQTVYAPDTAAQHQEELDEVYSDPEFLERVGLGADGTPPEGMTFVSRSNPMGTRVEDFTGTTAKVAVWYTSLFGIAGESSTTPVTESWYTKTFDLTWVGGDWKVVNLQQSEGPTPVGRDQTASTAEEMADAVEGFGGFTYAR